MLNARFVADSNAEIAQLKADRVYKRLNHLESPQGARVQMEGRGEVIVLSSNNYLGLANHPTVVQAGVDALHRYGAGTASVRFICGTFALHRELEEEIAQLAGTPASLSYVSAWNANEAFTPTHAGPDDMVLSDELNHASIIDSVRLAKSMTKCRSGVYKHSDMDDLRAKLAASRDARRRFIWTDGVFSMEGSIARLPDILELAREYDAIVIMDDSHATGVLGATGRGTAEHFGVIGEVDVITSTLGKALGGAAGGFVASAESVVDLLTQRSRPQLFSNALPPTVAASSLAAVRVLRAEPQRVTQLRENANWFRSAIREAGFTPLEGETPIVPIIVGETALAIRMSELLLEQGVFVTGFGFPVVPKGEARVRCQVSADHTRDDLEEVVRAFKVAGRAAGILT